MIVDLPAGETNALTCGLKITGKNFKAVTRRPAAAISQPDAQGRLVLSATAAELHGSTLQLETQGGLPDIGYWSDAGDWISWTVRFPQPGAFKVSATVALADAPGNLVVEVGDQLIDAQPAVTGGWNKFETVDLGEIKITAPGDLVLKVRAKDADTWHPTNLHSVQLMPAQ